MEQLIEVTVESDQPSPINVESDPAAVEPNYDHLNDEESTNTETARRRNRIPNPITWKRKRNALLRERGQSYYGIKTVVDEEGRKWCTEVPRDGRKMKPRCECKSPAFECKKVDDEIRQRLFDEFWALSWYEKRAYMSRLVVLGSVMRPRNRKDASFSRRSKSLKYFFEADGNRYRVCKTMFLNTFDLSQWSVHGWPKKWSSDDPSTTADVDCLLDESVAATSSWFEDFMARLPKEENTGVRSKKRKSSSPSTDSSKVDVTEEWISESDGEDENERVESTTISFVDVSAINCDVDDENVNSAQESTQYRECETSAPSVDLSSQQSDLHQMLLDMSRRMDDMQEKFDKRLQSLESQVSELSQNQNQKAPSTDSKMSVSFNGSTSSEEQEADSLTESQADAQNDDKSTNPRARAILSHITSHVEKCSLESCKTCRELRRISEDIETIPVQCCEDLWIPAGSITPRSTLLDYTRSLPRHRYASTRTPECRICHRNYENYQQLRLHLIRHTPNDKSCCHCAHSASN